MALSLPPLQQKRTCCTVTPPSIIPADSRRLDIIVRPLTRLQTRAQPAAAGRAPTKKYLIVAAEAVVHTDPQFAAEGWIAESVLVRAVEEIGGAEISGNATSDLIGGGEIDAGVAGRVRQSQEEKIAVGALAREVPGEREADASPGSKSGKRTGMDWAARQAIARKLGEIERIGGDLNQAVVIGVVTCKTQPACDAGFTGQIDAAGAGAIGVEVITEGGNAGDRQIAEIIERIAERETDHVVEPAGEIFERDCGTIVGKLLFDAGGPGLAGFRLEFRIAEVAELVVEELIETRLLNTLAIEKAKASFAPETAALQQRQGGTGAWDEASTEVSVGFGACAKLQRSAGMWRIAEIEKSSLIVAADMACSQKRYGSVFDFILIARGGGEVR